jgi:transcriptional regulator with XRE-family HTH domain
MLCEQLKIIRKANGFTQQQIADVLEIERSTYASYETGRNRPDVAILERFAKVFGVSVDYILSINPGKKLVFSDRKIKYNAPENEQLLSTLSKEEQSLIAKYRLCDEKNKNEIKQILKEKSKNK